MRLLDDVYYYNREQDKWMPSFIISIINDPNYNDLVFKRFLVAGYGPSLSFNNILTEDDYINLVDNKEIDSRTLLAQKSM